MIRNIVVSVLAIFTLVGGLVLSQPNQAEAIGVNINFNGEFAIKDGKGVAIMALSNGLSSQLEFSYVENSGLYEGYGVAAFSNGTTANFAFTSNSEYGYAEFAHSDGSVSVLQYVFIVDGEGNGVSTGLVMGN